LQDHYSVSRVFRPGARARPPRVTIRLPGDAMRSPGFFRLAHSSCAGLIVWMAIILCPSRALAHEAEPRLILPGGCLVRAGEVVDLQWSAADSISELEILLSTDGGRHYSVCISPELDPSRCEFLWRVPPLRSGSLCLRIRYNRRGREIEGAPASPLTVVAGTREEPEPLALPIGDTAGEKAPGPSRGRAEEPAERSLPGLGGDREVRAYTRQSTAESTPSTCQSTRTRLVATQVPSHFVAPRSIPLRA